MSEIRPYGDSTDDGLVQVSFTLPIASGERARAVARAYAEKMGLRHVQVVHMKAMGPDFTFFILYGASEHVIDPEAVTVRERGFPELTEVEIDRLIRERLKRRLVVVGACTGTDAHTVGLDAILSMKGFAGDKGLEHFHEMNVVNMGSQVSPDELVATVKAERADAVLVSQVVTQRDAHIHHLKEVRDALVAAGEREHLLLVGGGPRFAPEQADELGYDRIFGRGTRPSEVASYLAWAVAEKMTA
ncbi:MAG TPA: OAM dimerization domain-containing protein [Actinomycetota bacterium]|nr:OAM dimerization domain-containing protein [Actinomycetota bacterium]